MLEAKYCVLSFPHLNKHYVLRVADEITEDVIMDICGMKLTASMTSITDSFDEALTVYNNLKN